MRNPLLICLCILPLVLRAEDGKIAAARKALADGLPQVAIYQLQQGGKEWPAAADKSEVSLLLAEALFDAGRFAESAAQLENLAATDPKAQFRLAEAYAALGKPAEALPFYQKSVNVEALAEKSVIGQARMLKALNRTAEATALLAEYADKHPKSAGVVLELTESRLDEGDATAALNLLARLEKEIPGQAPRLDYLTARALLAAGQPHLAEEKLNAITQMPADLAAGVAISKAEASLVQKDAGEAEKILETFIDDHPGLPGLASVFRALDRVYEAQGVSSSTELRRWAEGAKSASPAEQSRAAEAMFYLARNEARSGKAERSRQILGDFLTSFPNHLLANEARAELGSGLLAVGKADEAVAVLQPGSGPRVEFVRGQALVALQKFQDAATAFLQAAIDPAYEKGGIFNSALASMLGEVPDSQNAALQRITRAGDTEALAQLRFLEAMHLASRRVPAAGDALREIADGHSPYAQRAALALAEWENLQLNVAGARLELRRVSTNDPAVKERADYLAIFLADNGEPGSDAEVVKLAEAFLKEFPRSSFEPDVRMKLGETLFRRGDYLGARGQFSVITEDFPGSPLAEKALFLSAQALSRSMDTNAMEEAIEVYEQVEKSGGPLALRARLEQAMLFNALKKPKEALGVLDRLLSSNPDPALRYMALIEKGDTYFDQGTVNPENYNQAIAAWKQISSDAAAPPLWSHQALTKMGAACEKLGAYDAALNCYYSVFVQGPNAAPASGKAKGEPEYFWYYKAGFDAASLLESQKLWKEAIAVYEKIGSIEGPRAEEAKERVNKLRLQNFIWDN